MTIPPVHSILLLFVSSTPPPEFYTLSLHDALPILGTALARGAALAVALLAVTAAARVMIDSAPRRSCSPDRKSTRLNSSHRCISYAVFCLKKKKSATARHSYKKRQNRDVPDGTGFI